MHKATRVGPPALNTRIPEEDRHIYESLSIAQRQRIASQLAIVAEIEETNLPMAMVIRLIAHRKGIDTQVIKRLWSRFNKANTWLVLIDRRTREGKASTSSARVCRVRRGSVEIYIDGEVHTYDSPAFERRENKVVMIKPDLSVWTENGGKFLGLAYRVRPIPQRGLPDA